jgi:hypothetical protein
MDDFTLSVAVSVLAVAAVSVYGADSSAPMSPLFIIALFSLCVASHFAVEALAKSGISKAKAAALYAVVVFASYGAMAISFASLALISRFIYVPFVLCIPAAVAAIKDSVSG